jgi:hypothetical protein
MGRLVKAMSVNLSYNDTAKREFKLAAMQALRKLAGQLLLGKADREIRYNAGGIAVSGEAVLHADKLYVQVSQSALGPGHEVLYRTCTSRTDYTGGDNHWAAAAQLEDPVAFAAQLGKLYTGGQR